VSRRSAAISDDAIALQVADDHLLDSGSAIAAAVAGFFAAAGQRPGVLLSPVTILLAGVGVGVRALDGRLRQPGLGAKRPRGFVDGEPIPRAARVAAPAGLTALLVALAYDDSFDLDSALRPGIKVAKGEGALRRAAVLERIGAVGARALTDSPIRAGLLNVGGPAEGGALTSQDLDQTASVDHAALEIPEGDLSRIEVPWAAPEENAGELVHGLCVMDARGFAVAVSYGEALTDGIEVPELELRLLPSAVPVRRGVPRHRPGEPVPAPGLVQLWLSGGEPIEARMQPLAASGRPALLQLKRDPRSRHVEVVRPGVPGASPRPS
jgi:hypothetical protein